MKKRITIEIIYNPGHELGEETFIDRVKAFLNGQAIEPFRISAAILKVEEVKEE